MAHIILETIDDEPETLARRLDDITLDGGAIVSLIWQPSRVSHRARPAPTGGNFVVIYSVAQ